MHMQYHLIVDTFLTQVSKVYDCVPRAAIDRFIQLCIVCHARKPQNTRAPLKPIVASGFMSRGQVKLVL